MITPTFRFDPSRLGHYDLAKLVALLAPAAAGRPLFGSNLSEVNRLLNRAAVPNPTPRPIRQAFRRPPSLPPAVTVNVREP